MKNLLLNGKFCIIVLNIILLNLFYFIFSLTEDNVISFWLFARQNYFQNILENCKQFLCKNFKVINKIKEFLLMSLEEIDLLYVFLGNDLL